MRDHPERRTFRPVEMDAVCGKAADQQAGFGNARVFSSPLQSNRESVPSGRCRQDGRRAGVRRARRNDRTSSTRWDNFPAPGAGCAANPRRWHLPARQSDGLYSGFSSSTRRDASINAISPSRKRLRRGLHHISRTISRRTSEDVHTLLLFQPERFIDDAVDGFEKDLFLRRFAQTHVRKRPD